MSLRSNALAVMMVALCPWLARAGDKIEFSAPGTSLDVPQVEHIDKDAKPDVQSGGPPINHRIIDASEITYTVVVVRGPKHGSGKSSDSLDGDDENGDQNENGSDDSGRRARVQPDSESSITYSERRNEDRDGDQSLRSRLEADDKRTAEEAAGTQVDERFGHTYAETARETPWTRDSFQRTMPQEQSVVQRLSTFSYDLLHHGLPGLDGVSTKAVASYNSLKGINEQYATQQNRGLDEAQQPVYDAQPAQTSPEAFDDARRRPEQDQVSGRLTFTPGEYSSVSLNPDAFVRPEAFKYQERLPVQEPPAILTFPKRPGALLR